MQRSPILQPQPTTALGWITVSAPITASRSITAPAMITQRLPTRARAPITALGPTQAERTVRGGVHHRAVVHALPAFAAQVAVEMALEDVRLRQPHVWRGEHGEARQLASQGRMGDDCSRPGCEDRVDVAGRIGEDQVAGTAVIGRRYAAQRDIRADPIGKQARGLKLFEQLQRGGERACGRSVPDSISWNVVRGFQVAPGGERVCRWRCRSAHRWRSAAGKHSRLFQLGLAAPKVSP